MARGLLGWWRGRWFAAGTPRRLRRGRRRRIPRLLREHDAEVARLLPQCTIPALRAVEPEPHWWGGHGTVADPALRLTSVQVCSGDPQAPRGPQVRVSTGEVEEPDEELEPVGGCQVLVEGEPLSMEVVLDMSAEDDSARAPRIARGIWRGYEIQVQTTGVPLDGLRLVAAGDLTQYRRYAPWAE
jgi:hypothetical protein